MKQQLTVMCFLKYQRYCKDLKIIEDISVQHWKFCMLAFYKDSSYQTLHNETDTK